jgi:hypothetical protein
MKIKLVYDASVAGAPASFTSVLNQGVQFLEQTFTNPITINIEVGWGEIGGTPLDPGVTGEGGPLGGTLYTYGQVKAALASNVASAVDATAVASLPATAPTGGGDFYLGGAEEKALGLIGAAAGLDGEVGFQGNVGVGAIEHEITHAMGRVAYLGLSSNFNEFSALDLFRYSQGVLNPTAVRNASFSIDRGKTAINIFANTSDLGDWSGATPDAFNAFSGPTDPFSAGDIEEMNVLGYTSGASTVGGSVITLAAGPQTVVGAAGDTIIGSSGPDVINGQAGPESIIGGSGTTTVYGGAGDTIAAGSGNTYIDGTAGAMAIAVGSGGTDTIIGSTAAVGAGVDALTGGAAAVQVQGLGKGDAVNFAAQTGNATVNATAGNIALTLGAGAAAVYAGTGDTVTLGSGS